jgi:PTS system nitrogen regulatory IIA component
MEDDFDIDSLAAYLHLSTAQVTKLVDRGNLPGRRVGGSWRFARAEIHHWLEERIGASDEAELVRVEGALEKSGGVQSGEAISIAQLLPLEAIDVALAARTRNSVITSMVELADRTGWLWDAAKMAEAIRTREDMYPTALENGVALLHPRRPMPTILDRPFLALGRTERGIPFGSSRGVLTDTFFLLCSIDDVGHLRTLARLSRLLGEPTFMAELRAAPDAWTVKELITQRETTAFC